MNFPSIIEIDDIGSRAGCVAHAQRNSVDWLAEAARNGVTHAAMEASSHGLAQRRLDGVQLKAAGFTNFTQDHLDYHDTFEEYFDAKAGLFARVLPEDGVAVVNIDDPQNRPQNSPQNGQGN